MQNEEIIKIIDNLKGKRKYEEKKSKKLGYNSLYDYFEDKILQKKKYLKKCGNWTQDPHHPLKIHTFFKSVDLGLTPPLSGEKIHTFYFF